MRTVSAVAVFPGGARLTAIRATPRIRDWSTDGRQLRRYEKPKQSDRSEFDQLDRLVRDRLKEFVEVARKPEVFRCWVGRKVRRKFMRTLHLVGSRDGELALPIQRHIEAACVAFPRVALIVPAHWAAEEQGLMATPAERSAV